MTVKTNYKQGQFCWVDLACQNIEDAKKFYTSLFDWQCEAMDTQGGPAYGQFMRNGKRLCGIGELPEDMKSQGVPPIWSSYINVENLDATVEKAVELGAKVTMPAMQILDAGWLAFIMDPTGGNVGLWQKNQHFGAELVNETGAWCWNELATRDAAKAKEFFAKLLGWEYEINPMAQGEYHLVKVDGQVAAGIITMTAEWGEIPPHWAVYFNVDDVRARVSKLEQLGGKVMVPPFETPVGAMSVVSDPHGAVFSMIQLNPASLPDAK